MCSAPLCLGSYHLPSVYASIDFPGLTSVQKHAACHTHSLTNFACNAQLLLSGTHSTTQLFVTLTKIPERSVLGRRKAHFALEFGRFAVHGGAAPLLWHRMRVAGGVMQGHTKPESREAAWLNSGYVTSSPPWTAACREHASSDLRTSTGHTSQTP